MSSRWRVGCLQCAFLRLPSSIGGAGDVCQRAQLQEIAARERNVSTAPLSAVVECVTFPVVLWRQVDVRWQEVDHPSFSAYLTGLARYDLLVGGPHASKTADCRSKLQRALSRKTLAARRKGRKRKLLPDHLIECAEGRSVAPDELEKIKRRIADTLRKFPLKG